MVLRKKGSKTIVTSRKGKVLGKHKTRKKALAQLGAIETSKARKKKKAKKSSAAKVVVRRARMKRKGK